MSFWRTQLVLRLGRADLEHLTIHEAALLLGALPPPDQGDRLAEWISDGSGTRWFDEPAQAIADAVLTATSRPYDPDVPLLQMIGTPRENEKGLWAVPGRSF